MTEHTKPELIGEIMQQLEEVFSNIVAVLVDDGMKPMEAKNAAMKIMNDDLKGRAA